jgi:hypothetical protein
MLTHITGVHARTHVAEQQECDTHTALAMFWALARERERAVGGPMLLRCVLRRAVSPSSSSILPSVSAWLASSKFSHCAYSTQAHGGSGTSPALAVPGNCHGVRTSIFFTARVLPSDFRLASHTVANPPDLQAPWRRRQRQLP